MQTTNENLISIEGLVLRFYTYEGVVQALDGIDLQIKPGEILGVVGETGCGKSVTSLSVMGVIPSPGVIEGGRIVLNTEGKGVNLLTQKASFMRGVRGRDISMVFQEPRAYLNPVYSIENQIGEVLEVHRKQEFIKRALETLKKEHPKAHSRIRLYERWLRRPEDLYIRFRSKIPIARRFRKPYKTEIRKEIVSLLKALGIGDPERVATMYPHELSGGMAQRAVIAMSLACNPKLLICDEPTTNLDVTVQAQILELITTLRETFKSSILYITHDLGVVAELCERVAVMYAGNVVEVADVMELFKNPLHPYASALLASIPRPGSPFKSIPGIVPSLINPPAGCRFNDRCSYAMDVCRKTKPKLLEVEKDHLAACFLFGGQ